MGFFEYYYVADEVVGYFGGVSPLWVSLTVGGLCFLVVYVFQAVGLYTIASREHIKNRWMAFVPFFNTYYIGVCGQKNKFFNIDTKKIAIAAAAIEFAVLCVYILSFVAELTISPYLVPHVEESIYGARTVWNLPDSFLTYNPDLRWASWCYNYLDYILYPINIIYILAFVVVLNCFFQTYSARRYFIFTLTSILFPVQGILIFAVRNNKGMSYAEYVRSVQERAYRQYRDQQNFNQNPYNQNPYSNGYNQPPYENNNPSQPPQQPTSKQDDPFAELGPKDNSDPFDEFKN